MSAEVNDRNTRRKVRVIGAGFSGLATAYYLEREGFDVEVIEAGPRAGGLISTLTFPFARVETAANGLLNSARVEELFRDLNLEVTPTLKVAKRRFIFRDGRPRRWPLGFKATLRMLWFLLRFLFNRSALEPHPGETVTSWARRNLGAEASQYTVEAFLQGIYAGNPERMSANLIFGALFAKTPRERDPKPAIRGTVSAPEGMGQLIENLRDRLIERGVRFQFSRRLEALPQDIEVPHVIATSCADAAKLLARLDPIRADALEAIELLPVITVTARFRHLPPFAYRGFGCLFPPVENRRALGVLLNGLIFPGRALAEGSVETWILGGASPMTADLLALSDEALAKLITSEREVIFGEKSELLDRVITRWPAALPHYTVELETKIDGLQGLEKNAVLVGNYLGQIGLAKILDRAARTADEITDKGKWRRTGSV